MSGGKDITEEELADLKKKQIFEQATEAARSRAPKPEPMVSKGEPAPLPATLPSVDINSPPDAEGFGEATSRRPLSFTEKAQDIGGKLEPYVGQNPIGAALQAGRARAKENAAPNTEDVEDPALLARRQAAAPPSGPEPTVQGGSLKPGGGPSYQGGAGGILIPGGMRPSSEELDVHRSKGIAPGVREAQGVGMGLQMQAAKQTRDANAAYYQEAERLADLKTQAGVSAQLQQQRLNEDRQRETRDRLDQIETLNQQAQGKPEDIWGSPQIFGRVAAMLLMGLGGGIIAGRKGGVGAGLGVASMGAALNGLVNQDIAAKLDARKQAGARAKAETDLLHLHLQRMDSEGKAIEATKMAYWDSLLNQMEATKANLHGNLNEAAYMNLQNEILEAKSKTAQGLWDAEADDIHTKQINKMAAPQLLGGGGAGPTKEIPYTITTPDGVSYALPNETIQNHALKRIDVLDRYKRMNQEILGLRAEAERLNSAGALVPGTAEFQQRKIIMGKLTDLDTQKGPLLAQMLDGSTLRKEEAEMYQKSSTKATEGLGELSQHAPGQTAVRAAADAVLRQQIKRAEGDMNGTGQALGGHLVERGYVTDPATGQRRPVGQYTGQDVKPTEQLAPRGFKPRDPRASIPTQQPTDRETTPEAPNFGYEHPAVAAAKKRKKN